MRAELHEANRLKKMLTIPLSERDRAAILGRIDQLYASLEEPRGEPSEPASLYTFDRPLPTPQTQPVPEPTAPEAKPRTANLPPLAPQPDEVKTEPETESPPVVLTAQEIETRSKLLADIADRITLLRAVWATTLSLEVARERDSWLSKLQEIAATMPKALAEEALGRHVGLLATHVQPISKPQISEKLQELVLPPSAPSLKHAEVLSEFYWHRFAPERPHHPEHPPGYIPDGLQSWVS